MIGTERGTDLVTRARTTVTEAVSGAAEKPSLDGAGPYGVFVTLDRGEQLRGCCGYPRPVAPIEPLVDAAAIDATCNDPRFPAVTQPELDDITVSLTVLSEPTSLAAVDPEGITVGHHGLIVSRDGRQGLLLPQVAVDHNWTAQEFLQQACRKAGLAPTAWRDDDVTIETFTAVVFTETAPDGLVTERSFRATPGEQTDYP